MILAMIDWYFSPQNVYVLNLNAFHVDIKPKIMFGFFHRRNFAG